MVYEDGNIDGDQDDDKEDKKKKKKKKKKDMKSNGRICLHIKKAIDLPAADRNGKSDPFCKV